MNKSDVLDRVAGATGVSRSQAENVLGAFFDTVRSADKGGDRVAWPGFGSFSTTARKARTGRNPRTGAPVEIPASTAVRFSASSTLKDFLNTGSGARKGIRRCQEDGRHQGDQVRARQVDIGQEGTGQEVGARQEGAREEGGFGHLVDQEVDAGSEGHKGQGHQGPLRNGRRHR